METPLRFWSQHLANFARTAFWLLLAVIILLQLTGSRGVDRQRAAMLGEFERERNSRVIAMIHRQESASFFGVPVADSISIDDSKAVEIKGPRGVSDEVLILADIAQKARVQVASFVVQVLLKRMPEKQAVQVATVLSEGRWTHDFPITVQAARLLGLKISTEMPRTVYDLMDLYPQGGGIRPSVWYVPLRRAPAQSGSTEIGRASCREGGKYERV